MIFYFFFFSSRRRHTRCGRDWSSDVCSSDLDQVDAAGELVEQTASEEARVAAGDETPAGGALVACECQVCGGEPDPARLELDADRFAAELDGLTEGCPGSAHRVEHELADLAVGRDRCARECGQHLGGVCGRGWQVAAAALRVRCLLCDRPDRARLARTHAATLVTAAASLASASACAWRRKTSMSLWLRTELPRLVAVSESAAFLLVLAGVDGDDVLPVLQPLLLAAADDCTDRAACIVGGEYQEAAGFEAVAQLRGEAGCAALAQARVHGGER